MTKQKPNHTDTFIQTMQRQTEEHHAAKTEMHEFKPFIPKALPSYIQSRIEEYRKIKSLCS